MGGRQREGGRERERDSQKKGKVGQTGKHNVRKEREHRHHEGVVGLGGQPRRTNDDACFALFVQTKICT